uniref:Zinc finger GRF-type domain-containing protein n=1 Tax=Brassica campestris TaxID=3711 RepID=M4DW39_BRACM
MRNFRVSKLVLMNQGRGSSGSSGNSRYYLVIIKEQKAMKTWPGLTYQTMSNEASDWEPSAEGDDGIPRTCYCGSEPVHGYSQTPKDPYRRYITCSNADDRDCHVWKWWDVAVEEELREFQRELNAVKGEANQREQKLLRLEKQVSEFTKKKSGAKLMVFSLVLGLVLLIVLGSHVGRSHGCIWSLSDGVGITGDGVGFTGDGVGITGVVV